MSDLPPPSDPVPPEVPPPSAFTQPEPPETPPPAPPEIPEVLSSDGDLLPQSRDEEMLGIAMHAMTLLIFAFFLPLMNLVGPLILWLIKRGESKYLDAHGKAVVNFNIGLSILGLIGFLPFIGWCIAWPAVIVGAVMGIIGTIKASEKKLYRYPMSFPFIK